VSVGAITAPPPHSDSAINKAIKIGYHNLLEERSSFFREVRQRIKTNRRLRNLVRARLHEIECSTTWVFISS
jgi:hypothetical protein